MSPIIVKHRSKQDVCSVTRNGIGMVQAVVEQAGWKINDRILVGFIEKARCILLRCVPGDEGFKLACANKCKRTGGRVYCNAFIRNYLQTLVGLPKKNIVPVYARGTEWTIALQLEPLDWQTHEFSKAGSNSISKNAVGVYELLGIGKGVLRVGEGKIKERINAHLKDQRFSPPMVKQFRYLALEDSTDGKLLEKILIEQYVSETGVMPRFQEIRA